MRMGNRPGGAAPQGAGKGPELICLVCSIRSLRLWLRMAGISGIMAILSLSLIGDSRAAEAKKKEMEEPPSVEMLEFLGEWQTREGDWFDPTEKELAQQPKQEQSQKRKEQGHE